MSYAKSTVDGKVAGLTKLGRTQKAIGLLCPILKTMSYSCKHSLLIKLSYYVLWDYYIMSVKLYFLIISMSVP